MTCQASSTVQVPRVAIRFCTQCKWNLRAAYYAQELLQTFGTSIGEVALVPVSGGIFTVTMTHAGPESGDSLETGAGADEATVVVRDTVLWDRKVDGGFPETKELKGRVRNIIDPDRDLGHIDRSLKKQKNQEDEQPSKTQESSKVVDQAANKSGKEAETQGCEDCK